MTFFYFGNCVLMTVGAYSLVYNYTALKNYNQPRKYLQIIIGYLIVQFLKMMIIATFIPTSATIMSNPNHSSYFPIQLFTHSLDVVDLMGIYYMLTTINVQSERRPLIVGFSWAIADLLLTKFLSLWVGARSQEFDWKYTIISLQSIVLLILYISQSFLLSKYMRQPTVKVYGLLILSLSINFICSYLSQMRMLNFFQQFIFQSISTVIFGLMTVVTVNCKPI